MEATTPNLMASRLRMSRKQIKILLSPRIKNLAIIYQACQFFDYEIRKTFIYKNCQIKYIYSETSFSQL